MDNFQVDFSDLVHCALQLILLELSDLLSIVCRLLLVLSAGIHCIIIDLQNRAFQMYLAPTGALIGILVWQLFQILSISANIHSFFSF